MKTSGKREHVTCAGCVVYRFDYDNDEEIEIVLVKPGFGSKRWGVPKGHMDDTDVSLIDCAIREVYEETGLLCMPEIPVVTVNPNEIKHVNIYIARQIGDNGFNPTTPDEIEDIGWFNIDELPPVHYYQIPMIDEACHILREMYYEGIPNEMRLNDDVIV